MIKAIFNFVLLFSIFTSTLSLNVTVYYESLCPESAQFITKQLYPNYSELKPYITLDFVPYGKAMHTYNSHLQKYVFYCQHGHMECIGNMYQACGLYQTNDEETQLEFINCIMTGANPANMESVAECASKANISFDGIRNCLTTSLGQELLAYNGNRTRSLEPNIYNVPAILLNGCNKIDGSIQPLARSNFRKLVCNKLEDPLPEFCQNGVALLSKIKNIFA